MLLVALASFSLCPKYGGNLAVPASLGHEYLCHYTIQCLETPGFKICFQNNCITFIYLCVYIHGWASLYHGMCDPEDSLQELVLSSHHVQPRGQTRVAKLGSQCLYTLSHFINSWF